MTEVTFTEHVSYIYLMRLSTNICSSSNKGAFLRGILFAAFVLLFYFNNNAQTYSIPDSKFKLFLINTYPALMDSMGNLKIANANIQQGNINCSYQNIKDLSGIEHFINISKIDCSNNQLSFIPSLAGYNDSLQTFNCANNRLSQLPAFRPGAIRLHAIHCNNNLLYTIPNFNDLTNLDSLDCTYNYLTFDDLRYVTAPNMNSFNYAPQFPVQIASRIESEENAMVTFSFTEDSNVATSNYKLFKNGMLLNDLLNIDTFSIPNIKQFNAGFYTWQITNSLFPDLTLTSTPQELVVRNLNNKIFTPDGDNNNDSYLIPCNGNSRIYNKNGKLMKELQGNAYWDGTDLHGNPVPSGAYIIQCGENSQSHVTLIR